MPARDDRALWLAKCDPPGRTDPIQRTVIARVVCCAVRSIQPEAIPQSSTDRPPQPSQNPALKPTTKFLPGALTPLPKVL
jgi:hypothetical protein